MIQQLLVMISDDFGFSLGAAPPGMVRLLDPWLSTGSIHFGLPKAQRLAIILAIYLILFRMFEPFSNPAIWRLKPNFSGLKCHFWWLNRNFRRFQLLFHQFSMSNPSTSEGRDRSLRPEAWQSYDYRNERYSQSASASNYRHEKYSQSYSSYNSYQGQLCWGLCFEAVCWLEIAWPYLGSLWKKWPCFWRTIVKYCSRLNEFMFERTSLREKSAGFVLNHSNQVWIFAVGKVQVTKRLSHHFWNWSQSDWHQINVDQATCSYAA